MPAFEKIFTDAGEFLALGFARAYLYKRGFSMGPAQTGAPIAVLFGRCKISKWHYLTDGQRNACHGTITGDVRKGPVTLKIFDHAPAEAHQAIARPDKVPSHLKGGTIARRAGIVCNEPAFAKFVGLELDPEAVADLVRKECGIGSRAELDHNDQAAKRFETIDRTYRLWLDCYDVTFADISNDTHPGKILP